MNSKKIKVTFVLPNLLPGGAERVFSFVAQNIDKDKFDVTLLIIGYSKNASYDVQDIDLVFLEKARVKDSIGALFNFIRKHKPEIVLSAVGHLNTITAYISFFFPKTKFISREVTVLSLDVEFFKTDKKPRKGFGIMSYLANNRFNHFDRIICQSQDMEDDIKSSYNVDDNKIVVINNPITDSFRLKENGTKSTIVQYITVGRLSKEKGYERILKLLSKLDFPYHYTIIGNGSEKNRIYALIEDLGLKEKITHIEYTKDVSKYLAKSDYFLQGSFFEGFPNCLIESCAVGTPVIAFNVPGGTKEIIDNGINGYMVPDEQEYFKKLTELRQWDSSEVRESVYKKFNKEHILSQYEELFNDLVK